MLPVLSFNPAVIGIQQSTISWFPDWVDTTSNFLTLR